MNVNELIQNVETSAMIDKPVSEWRQSLAKECQVYVLGENYVAKRFDQICYKFCSKSEAKDIVIDNLYALLRFKYFPKTSDLIDEKIQRIVSSFVANLKTTLMKITLDQNTDGTYVSFLPSYCTAFRNGVYNFKDNKWLFKYDVINIKELNNKMYMYTQEYLIFWYLNFDFEPLPFSINDISLKEFVEVMKDSTEKRKNNCFELMYNVAHDAIDLFDFKRFQHLCEILGYTIMTTFSQKVVMFIGSGQNGKNSLIDGCLTNRLIPNAVNNSLDDIEKDRFILGSLENRSLNVYLESSPKTYEESTRLKNITGSMYQTVENKGENKYTSIINVKMLFAANDQEKVKFSDTTEGFRRRINMLEIWYKWDKQKRFLNRGDYYDTTFSDDLHELKDDIQNTITFVYFAMYGLKCATKDFTRNFEFTYNDWKLKYTDVDFDLKDKLDTTTIQDIIKYIKASSKHYEECKILFFDTDVKAKRLYESKSMKELGFFNYDDMIQMLANPDSYIPYFTDHDVYVSVRLLQQIVGNFSTSTGFTQAVKKIYNVREFMPLYGNKPYVKCTFINNRLKILSI